MRRWTHLATDAAIERAAFDLSLWGYRELAETEKEMSHWYRFGDDAIVFFNWHDDCWLGEVAVHVCVKPESRSSWQARRFMQGIEIVGELLGFYRLRGQEPNGEHGYLKRLGWTEDDRGWYRCLGGAETLDWEYMRQATDKMYPKSPSQQLLSHY